MERNPHIDFSSGYYTLFFQYDGHMHYAHECIKTTKNVKFVLWMNEKLCIVDKIMIYSSSLFLENSALNEPNSENVANNPKKLKKKIKTSTRFQQ